MLFLSLYINLKFLKFVKEKDKPIFQFFLGLMLFDTVIVLGATYGLFKVLFKVSKFKKKYA